jgi:hypothetical protein
VERVAVFPDLTIFNAPEVSAWGVEIELRDADIWQNGGH